MDTVPEFHAKAPQATASEGRAQGPYVAATAGFEPTTLRSKGMDFTSAPPRPTSYLIQTLDPGISVRCLKLLKSRSNNGLRWRGQHTAQWARSDLDGDLSTVTLDMVYI